MTGSPIRVAFLSGVRHALPYAGLFGESSAVTVVGVTEGQDALDWVSADSRSAAHEMGVPFHADRDVVGQEWQVR